MRSSFVRERRDLWQVAEECDDGIGVSGSFAAVHLRNSLFAIGTRMKMRVMLDTSVCIEIMRGRRLKESYRHWQFSISSVVESELWAGVYQTHGKRERQKVLSLLSAVEVKPFDSFAADRSGFVLADLASKGVKIGDFDSLIAGHCLAEALPLMTINEKHFKRVPGLEYVSGGIWEE